MKNPECIDLWWHRTINKTIDYFALLTMRIRTSRKIMWSSRYQAGAGYYHQTKVWMWGSYNKPQRTHWESKGRHCQSSDPEESTEHTWRTKGESKLQIWVQSQDLQPNTGRISVEDEQKGSRESDHVIGFLCVLLVTGLHLPVKGQWQDGYPQNLLGHRKYLCLYSKVNGCWASGDPLSAFHGVVISSPLPK